MATRRDFFKRIGVGSAALMLKPTWVLPTDAPPISTLELSEFTVSRYSAYVPVTQELLDDSVVNLSGWMQDYLVKNEVV